MRYHTQTSPKSTRTISKPALFKLGKLSSASFNVTWTLFQPSFSFLSGITLCFPKSFFQRFFFYVYSRRYENSLITKLQKKKIKRHRLLHGLFEFVSSSCSIFRMERGKNEPALIQSFRLIFFGQSLSKFLAFGIFYELEENACCEKNL